MNPLWVVECRFRYTKGRWMGLASFVYGTREAARESARHMKSLPENEDYSFRVKKYVREE